MTAAPPREQKEREVIGAFYRLAGRLASILGAYDFTAGK
jgi:hypothetical protein